MEKERESCPWCGHESCLDYQKDKWPALHDGCCQCKAKIIEILEPKK